MGKGSGRRPREVSEEEMEKRWEATFSLPPPGKPKPSVFPTTGGRKFPKPTMPKDKP